MNKFLTKEELGNLLYKGDKEGNDSDCIFKYYNLVKIYMVCLLILGV